MARLYGLASELYWQLVSSPTDYQNSSAHCLLYLLWNKCFHVFSHHPLCTCRPKPHRSSQLIHKILPENLTWSSPCKSQHSWALEAAPASALPSPGGLLPHAHLKFSVLFFQVLPVQGIIPQRSAPMSCAAAKSSKSTNFHCNQGGKLNIVENML